MARMFPRPFPAESAGDPQRTAELKTYEALDSALGDDWTVFYGARWLSTRGKPHDGECDFVLAHICHGLLIIEVKGGEIRRDAHSGRWSSRDRFGQTHEFEHNPVDQAMHCKNSLFDKLREHPAWGSRGLDLGHAVCFPDCSAPRQALGPEAPLQICLFREDLKKLSWRVSDLCRFWSRGFGALGEEGRAILTEILARSFELRMPLGEVLEEDDRKIIRLSEEQLRVLDLLSLARRVAVSGGAGTGKTVLALAKAKRLASEGFRVLLTCYNNPLAAFLHGSAKGVPRLNGQLVSSILFRYGERSGRPIGRYTADFNPCA